MRLLLPLLLLCFLCSPQALHATHIVGGEMNYTCLGDDQYEITLTIYRDCFFGDPNAYFDDPASIGIFDADNQLIQHILVPLMGDDTLAPVLTDECLVVPPTVCVHTTTYATTVTLPPIIGGYQLAYQRCCRNQTIVNIVAPLATGATFGVTISEQALLECNSSPQFVAWPPLYICADEPIIFDQSAVDADGDSIVYRLCTPLTGATPAVPRPQPPNNPPYNEIVWNEPPYNEDNMLNGSPGDPVLAINPFTGLLTGTPNTIGQFVVGICLEEYRDGVLISTTRRDFQYNVGVCGQTTAAFFAPEVQCGDLEVSFANSSQGSNNFLWDFGDPNNPGATSTAANPSYTYPETGTYQVTLVVAPGEVCADTLQREVRLEPESLFPAFSLDTVSCGDTLRMQATNLSEDTLSNIVSYQWYLNGQAISTDEAPEIVFTQSGQTIVSLEVMAENGCTATFNQILQVGLVQEGLPGDTLFICPGLTAALNPSFNPNYDYEWSPAAYLDDAMAPNPIATPPVTTTYTVMVTEPVSGCQIERGITVAVAPPVIADAGPDVDTCEPTITLEANTNNGVQFLWSEEPDFFPVLAEAASVEVTPLGEATYYLLVRDQAGCFSTDTVTVTGRGVNVLPSAVDTFQCLGEYLPLALTNLDPADTLTYAWSPGELIFGPASGPQVLVIPPAPGTFEVEYTLTNQWGCTLQDTVRVTALDTAATATTLAYEQCGGYQVNFSATGVNAPFLQWDFGEAGAPSGLGAEVSHTYGAPGDYLVTATLPPFLSCASPVEASVVVSESAFEPGFSWDYGSCADTASLVFTDQSTYVGSELVDWQWEIAGASFSGPTASLTIEESSVLPVSLVVTAANGCTDTLLSTVEAPLIELSLPDSLLICPGASAPLNPQGNQAYDYAWSNGQWLDDPSSPNPVAMPPADATFSLTVSDPNSICERVGEVPVTVPPPITYDLSPDTAVCQNSWLLSVNSPEATDYAWSVNPTFSNVLGMAPNFLAPVAPGSVFYVRLRDAFGCEVIDQISVDNQSVMVELPASATVCVGDTLTLQAFSTGPNPATSYNWSPEAEIISGQGAAGVTVSPAVTTSFGLSVSNSAGCTLDTTVTVNVFNFTPPLTVTPTLDTVVLGESIVLRATDSPNYTYLWQPPLYLDASDVAEPVSTPEEDIVYTLVIRDGNGCINTAQTRLVVIVRECAPPYLYLPNAFTPNDDGRNDLLRVEGNNIEEMYLAIYDRWGELVFETRDPSQGWDGTFKGERLPPDAYGYYLEVRCVGGETYVTKGNVTLLR